MSALARVQGLRDQAFESRRTGRVVVHPAIVHNDGKRGIHVPSSNGPQKSVFQMYERNTCMGRKSARNDRRGAKSPAGDLGDAAQRQEMDKRDPLSDQRIQGRNVAKPE